jgi:iron complex transport system substrate-binding protein
MQIISLVPSLTETLFDLGLEDYIVGVTKFCVHPNHLKAAKTVVGGTKQVNFEKVHSLKPDIIIANKEENTLEMVLELEKICPVMVTEIYTIEDALDMISKFGELFQKRVEAQKWIAKINFSKQEFERYVTQLPIRKVAYFIWANPYMVAGNQTFINHLLQKNHFENIYQNKQGRYPEIDIQKIRTEGDPELILLSSEPFPFKNEHAIEVGSYTHHGKTIFVDGEMFSWYGTRLLKAFDYFRMLQRRIEGSL